MFFNTIASAHPWATAKRRASFFGYETKYKREQIFKLTKTHFNDAIAICGVEDIEPLSILYIKKHVAKGDYQQHKGKRSEIKIPTGKLFGFRKFDLVKTSKGIGFIQGKRSSGFFAISDIMGKVIGASVNIKKDCLRLRARTTNLIWREGVSSQA